MFGAIVILFLSIAAFYLGYQGIRHKRTFWFEDGEKNNKKSKIGRSEMFPLFYGILMSLLGAVIFYIFVKSFYRYLTGV
jgi:hypothetical protein